MNLSYIIIDTSGCHNFVAGIKESGPSVVYALPENIELGGVLNGVINHLFPRLDGLLGLGVCLGPGNFSATRVGLSFALGLSHSLNIPLAGYSALEGYFTGVNEGQALLLPLGKKGGVITLSSEFTESGGMVCEHACQLGRLISYGDVESFCLDHEVNRILYAKATNAFLSANSTMDVQKSKKDIRVISKLVVSRLHNSHQFLEPDYRSCTAFF